MLRSTIVFLRKGNARTPIKSLPNPSRLVPASRRPHQGGQQYFQDLMLAKANDDAARAAAKNHQSDEGPNAAANRVDSLSTLAHFSISRGKTLDGPTLDDDSFVTTRVYNERHALSEYRKSALAPVPLPSAADAGADNTATAGATVPDAVRNNDEFTKTFGYSLVRKPEDSQFSNSHNALYENLDLWAEQTKYRRGTYFLYLVARRRNAYAVVFDFDGKRVHPTYSVGNRGLKNSDKGFKADGSAENAHIVTSQYLNDAVPKILEMETLAGRMKAGEKKKIDVVVRVLGFYNARGGGVRAVTDRQDVLNVIQFEDITPFPLNGPKMPKKKKHQ